MVIKYPNQIANGNSARKFHIKNIISYGKSMESGDKTAFCMLAIFRTDGKDS